MSVLTLVRGVPGSGKSTMALELLKRNGNADHWEADMFFIDGSGLYSYDPRKVAKAHKWCLARTAESLKKGRDVIVSNTFIRRWELDPYLKLSIKYDADVVYTTCVGRFKNVHGVPDETVESMRDNMEGA